MDAKNLISELIELTENNRETVENFKELPLEQLNYKPNEDSWSVLECIEHLNRYGDFYIPEISKALEEAEVGKSADFKPGILGDYFAKSMLPKEKLNKMKTFKSMNPNKSVLDNKVLGKFIDQQNQLIELLNRARQSNLTKLKTPISITKWIKLRLGDTFRVVIFHNVRHMEQAQRVMGLR